MINFWHLALYNFEYLIILLCGKLSPLFYDWFLFLLNYLYYFKIFNMIKANFVNGLISTRNALPPYNMTKILNKTVTEDIRAGDCITWSNIK